MQHARSGKILIQMAVIIVVGVILGVADATLRPIDLSERKPPPPIPQRPQSDAGSPKAGPRVAPRGGEPEPKAEPESQSETPATPTQAPIAPAAESSTAAAFVPTKKESLPVGHITIDEAFTLYQQGLSDNNTFFIDARKMEEFVKDHVPNAIRIDTAMFQIKEPDELGLIPRTANVVVYCNGGHCDESENVAKRLDGSGYRAVYVLHDGLPGWKAMGHPVQSGE